MRLVRLPLLCAFAAIVLFGLTFAVGTIAGLTYGGRTDKTCALVESNGALVPVCEYGYRPPEGWSTR